jgi:predicted outer membrane repeat protein
MSGGGMFNLGNPTLTNCTFSGNWGRTGGGGMMNGRNNPTLTDCTFSKNTGGNGGGMWNGDSRLVLAKCKFSGNTGSWGGGMKNYKSSLTLTNCTFIGNSAEGNGGGIYNSAYNKLTLTNCAFIGNSAEDYAGGICNDAYNNLTFTNCTFSGNSAPKGNALACKASRQQYRSNLQVSNCILWDGSNGIWNSDGSAIAIRYSDVQGGETAVYDPCDGLIWGDGNIDTEPIFADLNNGDYHLKSQAGRWDENEGRWTKDEVTSPCIDAGDMGSPIGNELFPNGGVINMGAYGGTVEASKSYFGQPVCETIIAGDINGDCIVDWRDFALMAFHWLEER